MGCARSHPDNAFAADQLGSIDIELLASNPPLSSPDTFRTRSFGLSDYRVTRPVRPPPSAFQAEMIERPNATRPPAPDVEQSRQVRFVEQFSRISANTLQGIPIFSVQPPSETGTQACHDIRTHCRWMEPVLDSLVRPLNQIRVNSQRPLVITID
jgi:hypothetical protein